MEWNDGELNADAFTTAFEDMLRYSMRFLRLAEPDAQRFIEQFMRVALSGGFEFFNCIEHEGKRSYACVMAIRIWNSTPLPSHQYRPVPLAKPDSNAPCFCGSGAKYGQCCKKIDASAIAEIPQEMTTRFLLESVSKTELKQVWRYLPHRMLGFIAGEWSGNSDTLTERALCMLDPIFKQDDAQLDHGDESAFDAMLTLCALLDKPRKKSALIKRIMQHPDKTLRASALHSHCCMLSDQGRVDDALACFQKVQRLNPDDPALSHLELLLLVQQGNIEQMRRRGKFWIKRLGNMNQDGKMNKLIELIQNMVADTPTLTEALIKEDAPVVERLISWLKKAVRNPAKPMNRLKIYDGAGIIEPKNRTVARLEAEWNEMMLECDFTWERVNSGLNRLEAHPELGGSMLVLDDLTRMIEDLDTPDPTVVFAPLATLAMLQLNRLLPQRPKVPLEGAAKENAPALSLLDFLVRSMLQLKDPQMAMKIMIWSLRLNPTDHQSYRCEVMYGYLHDCRDEKAISLAEDYAEDMDVRIRFGHALALFRLDRMRQANIQVKRAIRTFPMAAKALTQQTMKQPDGLDFGMLTHGGENEAWCFREYSRRQWLDTPGAMTWLKQQMEK